MGHTSRLGLVLGVALATPALADEEGIELEICVQDPSGAPVPTAVVRHPDEKERHRVNTVTGCWSARVLYLPDGQTVAFEKGQTQHFEISAVDHVSEQVLYLVHKRRNRVVVTLAPLDDSTVVTPPEEEPVVGFVRSRPIDGTEPASPSPTPP